MPTSTHIIPSGGLISAAFIENVRELSTRQRGVEPESFALPWAEAPKSPAVLEEDITFPIVRRKDEERWGEYRTKRLAMRRQSNKETLWLKSTTGTWDQSGSLYEPRSWRELEALAQCDIAPS